jgi:hypothetical protein
MRAVLVESENINGFFSDSLRGALKKTADEVAGTYPF